MIRTNSGFSFFSILFWSFIPVFVTAPSLSAQTNQLTKISSAKRSDGKGFVIRFQLQSSLDSAKVIQVGNNLIQVAAYASHLSISDDATQNAGLPVASIESFQIENGYGFNFTLHPDTYVIAHIYPDQNKKDWLLGLTFASKKDIQILTEGIEPISWETTIIPNENDSSNLNGFNGSELNETYTDDADTLLPEGIDFDFTTLDFDSSYTRIKDKSKFDVVVIDAGHGGKDSGTIGFGRSKEKDIALSVALKLGNYIETNMPDVKVYYTRKDDRYIELEDRGHFANKVEGDLFISIHLNAAKNRNAFGTEVFFLGQHRSEDALDVMLLENSVVRYESKEGESKSKGLTADQLLIYELTNSGYMADSQYLAQLIDEQFKNRVNRKSRGVKQAGFIVLYYASMPAILVELGFISNKNEEKFLVSEYGQSLIASAIFRAVRDYKERSDRKSE